MWIQKLTIILNDHPDYRKSPVTYDVVAKAISRASFSKGLAERISVVLGISVELLLYPDRYGGDPIPLLKRLCGGVREH